MDNSADFDNRWSERQDIHLRATLLDHDQEILQANSKNTSIGGIFIGPVPQGLDIGQKLQIAFSLHSATSVQRHRLPARVVRNHDNGAALAFSDYDFNALNTLRILPYDDLAR
ncbi:MAG TPA: PilZ domain-containing protein [Gammaproteobacteria bacterium]|nr:PilZ domain-containing protein [Gammaproteobacteria bacterium]